MLPAIAVCGWCNFDLDPHTCTFNSNWSSSMQVSPNLHFQVILQVDLRWPLTLICDLLTTWTYVMWSSKISRKSEILILRQSQTKQKMSFVSYCFWHPSTAHIFGTNQPISMGFSAKCSCKNGAYSKLEKWKLNLTDFRLILLDHTTYEGSHIISIN